MEVAKLAAPPNLEVRFVSCNESAIKRWLSSELEETVFSLTHELFMTKHHTVTLNERASNLIVSIGNFTHNANCPRVRDAQSGVDEYKRGVAWPEGSAPRTGGRFKLLLAQLHTLSKTHSTRQLQHFSTVSTTVTRETHRK